MFTAPDEHMRDRQTESQRERERERERENLRDFSDVTCKYIM